MTPIILSRSPRLCSGLAICITAHCPECGESVYYPQWQVESERGEAIKTVFCINPACLICNERYKLDLSTGLVTELLGMTL